MKEVVVYTRAGCHLCDEALAILRRLQAELAFAIREVDIDQDDDLLARYQWTIPVIAVDGNEIAAAPIEERALRRALRLATQE